MSGSDDALLTLTAFLLKARFSPLAALTPTYQGLATTYTVEGGEIAELVEDSLPESQPTRVGEVFLVLLRRTVGPPGWQRFIETTFGVEGFPARVGESLGALVFTSVTDPLDGSLRWIVWTFGSGSRAFARGTVDPRFGLVTALNRIAAGGEVDTAARLRQFQYQQFGAYRQSTSHRAARDTPLEGFRFDRQLDLLSGAGGPRSDTGAHIYGARPLRVRERVGGADDFPTLAQGAMDDYRANDYTEDFSFIDDHVLVEDDVLLTMLRTEVFADLAVAADTVDAFIPDDLIEMDSERQIQYILLPGEQARLASRTTLTVDALLPHLQGADETALDWTLRFCDSDREVVADATLLECLTADVTVDGNRYLAADGSFFRVRQEFLDAVDAQIDALTPTDLTLPCYRGEREGPWNQRVANENPDEFVCLDGDLIRLTGRTPFEAADLVHVTARLVHVKRKGRSSSLSYLFVQAVYSCQILAQVPDACQQLRDKVAGAASDSSKAAFESALGALDSRAPGIEVVLAVLGDWKGRTLRSLPLMAKLELAQSAEDIGLSGFVPTVALVDICR